MRQVFVAKSIFSALLLCIVALPVYSQEIVETVYYDSINDGNGIDRRLFGRPGSTASVPDPNNEFGRTFTGSAINTVGSGPITRMDFLLSAVQLQSFQSIQVNVQFWNSFGSNLGTSWFGNAASFTSDVFNVSSALPSNITFVASSGSDYDVYNVSLLLDSPFNFTDSFLNGVSLNIKGNTGSGFFNTNNLSTMRTRGNGYLAGSSPILDNEPDRGGHLRNNSGRTDYNFTNDPNVPGADLFFAARNANEALGIKLYNQVVVVVPETNTLALLALGAAVPVAGLVRRRKK